MNHALKLMCILSLAGAASAQTPDPGDAADLLNEVANAYQSADVLTDRVSIVVNSPAGSDEMSLDIAFDGVDGGRVSWQGYNFVGAEGSFFITRDNLPNKYIRKPLADGFVATLLDETNGGFPVPHFALRSAGTTDQYLKGFGLGQLEGLSLSGVEEVTRDGKAMKALKLSSPQGKVSAFVDPGTKLIADMEITFGPFSVNMAMQPAVNDGLAEPIAVNTEGRQEVDVLKLEIGDPAPDFELPTPGGETVRLSDLRGNMVVLDFWATWCGPCMRGLPEVDKFAKWAASSGKPIRVLGVDGFERLPTDEQKKAQIEKVWKAKGFSFPTLIDYTSEVALSFEVGPIPHTVVIDPQGRIHSVHVGFDPNTFSKLQDEAAEVLKTSG